MAGEMKQVACAAVILGAGSFAHAQVLADVLSDPLSGGQFSMGVSASSFRNGESATYGNLILGYGWREDIEFRFRASGARRSTFGSVRTGGTDLELQGVYHRGFFYAALGIALPDTPAQDRAAGTFTVGLRQRNETGTLFYGVTGVTSEDVTLVGVGASLEVPVGEKFGLQAGVVFPVRGDNTRLSTGASERENLLSIGARYRHDERQSFFVGFSNALGRTTGFGLTPKLGSGLGFHAGIEVRF